MHNIKVASSTNSRIMAVLKADAYGLGMTKVAEAISPYVDYYAVAFANEGVRLREVDALTPILILVFNSDDIEMAIEYDLTLSISSIDELQLVIAMAIKYNTIVRVHFAVNTGMNRYGFSDTTKYIRAIEIAIASHHIKITGVYSHFYDNNTLHNALQMAIFDSYLEITRRYIGDNFLSHISASSGAFGGINKYDMVRLGIGMYVGDGAITKDAFSLHSTIQSIRRVKSGEFVGYSCVYKAKCDIILGVIYGGYADGLDRRLTGHYVSISNKRVPIIGNICMDVFFVDLSNMDGVQVGDDVTIIGDDISIQNVADHMCITTYEVITSVRGRTMRSYFNERECKNSGKGES